MSWGIAFRLRQQLKGSMYALPVLGALLGPVLGQLTLWLDRSVQLPEAWSYSAATATAVLSVLVGAMVALLGFVVTIGVLVVQMATGTLSPRYMRLWYRDLLQKVVLATLAGTLTFSFSLLRHVEDTSVPDVGVTLAGVLVTVSLLLLLVYLNRFTHSLRPVAVAATVADAGRRVVPGPAPTRRRPRRGRGRRRAGWTGRPVRRRWSGPRGRAPSRRSTSAGCWPWPAGTTTSSSCCTRSVTSCPPGPAWSRSTGRRRSTVRRRRAAHVRPGLERTMSRTRPWPCATCRHRRQGAVTGGQRPHHRRPGAQLHRGPPAGGDTGCSARSSPCGGCPGTGGAGSRLVWARPKVAMTVQSLISWGSWPVARP